MARRMSALVVWSFSGLMFLSTAAYAQSVITGTVKDGSGAAMPGVTIEAASPVLIERVKSVVSPVMEGAPTMRSGKLRIISTNF